MSLEHLILSIADCMWLTVLIFICRGSAHYLTFPSCFSTIAYSLLAFQDGHYLSLLWFSIRADSGFASSYAYRTMQLLISSCGLFEPPVWLCSWKRKQDLKILVKFLCQLVPMLDSTFSLQLHLLRGCFEICLFDVRLLSVLEPAGHSVSCLHLCLIRQVHQRCCPHHRVSRDHLWNFVALHLWQLQMWSPLISFLFVFEFINSN